MVEVFRTNLETTKLKELGRGMCDEDVRIILTQFKTELMQDELSRRQDVASGLLDAVYDRVYSAKIETLNDAEAVLRSLKRILEGRKDDTVHEGN